MLVHCKSHTLYYRLTQLSTRTNILRGPCLYLHAVGPGNFWSACQMLTETGGRGEGFRYVWFLSAAALRMWILNFVAIPGFLEWARRVDFGGDFKAAMSLDQSPLATSSGVNSSGWAVLQRRQDIISERDCDGRWDSVGVHKGLVFTVIVTLSLSSFLTSTILFSLLTSWWSSFPWFCCGRDIIRRVKDVDWNRGVARGACLSWLCGRICRSQCVVPVLRQGFLLSREDSDGGHLCPEEGSGGFLRPSLEETLASNRSTSVGEEERAAVVGSCRIRFLLSSLCLPFVFLLSLHTHLFLFFFCCQGKEFLPGLFLLWVGRDIRTSAGNRSRQNGCVVRTGDMYSALDWRQQWAAGSSLVW